MSRNAISANPERYRFKIFRGACPGPPTSPKKLNEFVENGEGTDIIKLSSQYFSAGHNFVWFLLRVWK